MPIASARDITGVILVGGKSRRMGRDKALLKIYGRPLVERVLAVFRECFGRVVLVGDDSERFAPYDLPVLPDIYPGSALGGLYTGLFQAATDHVFVSSCDLPYPSAGVVRYLCALREGYDAVVPLTGDGFEPLFAVYAKSCLGPMRELLERRNYCVYDFYPAVRVRCVTGAELAHLDPDGRCFRNVNTPEELARVMEETSQDTEKVPYTTGKRRTEHP
jgi:molybdopterin-guanine dinucleotide biosynthesis protein A